MGSTSFTFIFVQKHTCIHMYIYNQSKGSYQSQMEIEGLKRGHGRQNDVIVFYLRIY